MLKKFFVASATIFFVFYGGMLTGCDQRSNELIVYSGKGLEKVMEEIKESFEDKYDLRVEMIYAGSDTLLSTITRTRIGDVFIPGSVNVLHKAGDLVHDHRFVSTHVPVFAIRRNNPKKIASFEDLLLPGITIAVGNKNMCAIGRTTEDIIDASSNEEEFTQNISISGSTVNELLDLVLHGEVDASLVWGDMLLWPEAKDLQGIEIPRAINSPQEVHVAVLSTATDKKNAALFADFVATEGKSFFVQHGFGE